MKSLERLKALIHRPTEREFLLHPTYPIQLHRRAINQITGFGKTEFTVSLLASYPQWKSIWIEEKFSIHPSAFLQRNVTLEKIFFISSEKDWVWSTIQALKSQLFQILVISMSSFCDEKILRRFQLLAKKSDTIILLLSEKIQNSWPISLHIQMSDLPQPSVL